MSKKYLSIEEAAEILGVETSELNRLRERGEIRAFADRGTWKFKSEDIDKLHRTRQADSDPDVPLHSFKLDDDGDSAEIVLGDEEALSEQPTIIRRGQDDGTSDSDVRLFFDDSMRVDDDPLPTLSDSDSDVQLAAEARSGSGSDSDVRLLGQDTVSDVRLTGGGSGSDSDVKLVSNSGIKRKGDSGVTKGNKARADQNDTVELSSDSVFDDDDSGVMLAGGSGISLASESGISLDKINDSGISLDDDSGISLDDDHTATFSLDSGIGLAGESGIALSGPSGRSSPKSLGKPAGAKGGRKQADDDLGATIPMMDSPLGDDDDLLDTQMESPALADDADDDFDIPFQSDDSSVITLGDESGEVDDYAATMVKKKGPLQDDDDVEEDLFDAQDTIAGDDDEEELEVADDVLGEDDALDELDAFGADDDDFESEIESGASAVGMPAYAPRGIQAPVEQEWGAATFVSLALSTVLMITCGTMMFDLVRNMWHTDLQRQNPVSSSLLEVVRDMF